MLANMLMAELLEKDIMVMGPSRDDPQRQVGVLNKELVVTLPAARLAEMEKVKWLSGEWTAINKVPASHVSPAYTDINTSTLKPCEKGRVALSCRSRPERAAAYHV
jgi:hypothetical protein